VTCNIMRTQRYHAVDLQRLLHEKKVCTLAELMHGLGTRVRMTAMRKLAQLQYVTSYSDRGRFYALKSDCRFDRQGLWSQRRAWFSLYGTLLNTGQAFIDRSPAGFTVAELDAALHVKTQQALLHLERRERIHREKLGGVFVYVSARQPKRAQQLSARRQAPPLQGGLISDRILAHELKAAIVLFFGLLDEQQRRLFAGLESLKAGTGGDAQIARLLGVDPHSVARGRRELLEGKIDATRVRKPGGGRPAAEKKLPKSSSASKNS
jgi:hypothetical protein